LNSRKSPRRQVFVLTPDEKKAVCCVVGAFLLGVGTLQYRAAHPRSMPMPESNEQQVAAKAASTPRPRKARSTTARPTPTPDREEEEE